MKISAACLFLVAALTVRTSSVEAGPLVKRSCYNGGKATLTNYWVPHQGAVDEDNDGHKLHLTGPKHSAIKGSNGRTIAMVDKYTWEKCDMEGTCVIENHGKAEIINLANDGGKNGKFDVLGKGSPFGLGSNDNPLRPYISVAVNDLPIGTTLFVKELRGKKLPNGRIHNGCVAVDDKGWSFGSCQLDFFVLAYENYLKMNTPEHATVTKKKCKLLNYATTKDYAFVGIKPPGNTPKGPNPKPHTKPSPAPKKHKHSPKPKSKPKHKQHDSQSCNSGSTFVLTYDSTSFGGSKTCSAGSGCHNLSAVIKSSKWPSGNKVTFYASSGCTGESLYVDTIGEDEDISGDGKGFHAGSVLIE